MAAKVHFQCTDLEETSFPDATFDAILCSAALVFLSDVPGALATWRRWLKPGGASRVVFNTPKQHASAAFEVFAAEGLKVGAPKIEDPSTIFSSEYDVWTILGKAGFGTVDVRTWLAGRGYQGTSAAEYAASMWKVCSASPFSPVDQLVGTEAAEAWQRGFLAAATRLAEEKLTGDDGVIRDNHDMFWVVARNDAQK